MKRTTGILVCTLAAGMAWAQNPQVLQTVRTQMNTVQQNNTSASNQALGIKSTPAKDSAKPAATPAKSSPAAVKPSVAKSSPAMVKTSAAPTKAAVVPVKAVAAPAKSSTGSASASKSAEPFKAKKPVSARAEPKLGVKQITAKKPAKPAAAKKTAAAAAAPAPAKSPEPAASASSSRDAGASSSEEGKGDDDAVKEAQEKKWSMSGKRDPFISPVVSHAGGSGCSTGKKCLEIGAINLRGVVHSDGGFIAVVTNNLNKAYFLRENDPVFDGYVVKITGDSIVFKATMQDRLGKTFTREVTKKITTPAV
jgi:hypothetical protein